MAQQDINEGNSSQSQQKIFSHTVYIYAYINHLDDFSKSFFSQFEQKATKSRSTNIFYCLMKHLLGPGYSGGWWMIGWLQGWKPRIPYSVSYEQVTVRSSDLSSLNSAHDAFSRTTREINKWLKSRGVMGKNGKAGWWLVAGWCHLTVLGGMSPSTV